jgi:HK97 family phage major capsid protein
MAKFSRTFQFERSSADEKTRSVRIAFSSELPVDRGDFDEILDHSTGCDLSLMHGAPLLLQHRAYDPMAQVGVIDDPEIGEDHKLRCNVRFSQSDLGRQMYQDVADGIRRQVSVGYERGSELESKVTADGKRRSVRFSWRPFEGSLVTVAADSTVGPGRSKENNPSTPPTENPLMKRSLLLDPNPADGGGVPKPDDRKTERERIQGISATADELSKKFPDAADNFRKMAGEAIEKDTDIRDFKALLFKAIPENKPAPVITARSLGMNEIDQQRFSFLRGIQRMLAKKPLEGIEKEVDSAMRSAGFTEAQGMAIPFDLAMPASRRSHRKFQQRDMNVGTFGQGGALVPTFIPTTVIELLRNRMVCMRAGAQTMSGLSGNVALPRQTGAATAYALPEQANLTKSTQALDQITLTPHRVGAWNDYSRQLILQSAIDVENFMRDDLMRVLAIKWDYLMLAGSGGGDEPTGIINTAGVLSVLFGGTATWAEIVSFETALATMNADAGRMTYITTPSSKGRLKTVAKTGVGVTSVVPIFLWEGDAADEYGDGEMNGYTAMSTNQVPANAMIFGNFEELIHAMWGGYDVIVDPYTEATAATVRVVVNTFGDVAVRHPVSFCVSADAANQ